MGEQIPVGTKVILKYPGIQGTLKGVKFKDGVFRSDEYDPRLHHGGGLGPNGHFYYTPDHYLEPYDVVRKKTGFAKFIERMNST